LKDNNEYGKGEGEKQCKYKVLMALGFEWLEMK
jgi:hypothetical protein